MAFEIRQTWVQFVILQPPNCWLFIGPSLSRPQKKQESTS